MHTRLRPGRRLTAALATELAVAGVVASAPPAAAAPQSVSSGTADWGLKESFRSYIVSPGAAGEITASAGASQAGGNGVFTFSSATGDVDVAAGAAELQFTGSVRFEGHHGALDLTISDPRLEVAGGAGTVYVDYSGTTSASDPTPVSGTDIALANLTGVTVTGGGSTATISSSGATLAESGVPAFAGFYAAGAAVDPLTASVAWVVPATATTTTLVASPASPQPAGTAIELTATVSPAAAGTVRFLDGAAPIGDPVPAAAGVATSTTSLPAGSHSLTAQFIPADSAAFEGSTSVATAYVIENAPDAANTSTAAVVASSPQLVEDNAVTSSPAVLGATVTLSTAVSPVAAGTVQFTDGAAVIGAPAAVDPATGVASLAISTLAAGGHSLGATFIPADPTAFNGSSAETALQYGVADPAVQATCQVSADSVALTDVDASWKISSTLWAFPAKDADGDISVGESEFLFENGEGTADGDCAVLEFDGSLSVTNAGRGDYSFTFTDPTLTVGADGAGSLTADVTAFVPYQPASERAPASPEQNSGPVRVTVATFTGAGSQPIGRDVAFTAEPAFADSVATGTWAPGYDDAFANELLLNLPTGSRAQLFQSSAGATQANKATAPITASYTYDEVPTETSLAVSPANPIVVGTDVTLTATVAAAFGAPIGTVAFFEGEDQIAAVTVVDGVAVHRAPATSVGSATVVAQFVGADGTGLVTSTSAPYVITVDEAPVVVYTPSVVASVGSIEQGQAITFTGTGFAPGESVSGVVDSDPVSLGMAPADSTGTVGFAWTVPANFAVGAHSIVLTGASSGAAASSTFEVVAPPVACLARSVSGASLTWGIKSSFVTYINGPIANGSVRTSGVGSGNGYTWSGGSGSLNPASVLGLVSYAGSVSFTGHGGLLELTLSNPRIQITGPSSALLLVNVNSKSLETGAATSQNGVSFASLSLGAGSNNSTDSRIAYSGVPATLTTGGAYAFSGFYNAGAALDPVAFALPLGDEVTCDSTTDPVAVNLASTGVGAVGTAIAALLMLTIGGGLVLTGRRRQQG